MSLGWGALGQSWDMELWTMNLKERKRLVVLCEVEAGRLALVERAGWLGSWGGLSAGQAVASRIRGPGGFSPPPFP